MAEKIIIGAERGTPNWWTLPKNQAHEALIDKISELQKRTSARRDRNLRSLMLYGNYSSAATSPIGNLKMNAPILPDQRVKINIVSSMVDTVCAKISKMRPRVTFLTSEGDFKTQDQAKKLSKFIIGAFYKNKIYDLHQEAFRKACIWDLGILKHYVDGDLNIQTEQVMPNEIFVDEADAMYGLPRTLSQIKYIQKDVLKSLYPKKAALIEKSVPVVNDEGARTSLNLTDYCVVVESWHLPTKEGAGDGRHIICTDKVTLEEDEYTKDYFPFTFFYWSKPTVGFYGQSLAERLMGNQIEINKMLRIIQKSFHLGSAFKVFLEYGSKVSKDHINNDVGSIVYYAGQKPEFYVPQTVHPEYFRHLDYLIKMSYEEAGVSQLSASAKMPAGIDGGSGKAIREYNDLETERFILVSQMYEATFLHTAKIYIDLAKDIAAMGGDFHVVAASKKFVESIKWSDIKIDEEDYVMQMFPTNALPHEPAGRLAYIQELIQAGFVDQATAKSLLDFPDIEEYDSLTDAFIDDLRKDLYQILDGKEFVQPEPFQNLQYGITLFQNAYLRARRDGASTKVRDNLLRWIKQATALNDQAKQAAAAQQMAMQAAGVPPQQAPQDQGLVAPSTGAALPQQ